MDLRLDGKDLLILHLIYQGTPSMHDLRRAIQVRSVGTVANRLNEMKKHGLVKLLAPRQARAHRITPNGISILKEHGLVNDGVSVRSGVGSSAN